MFPYPSGVLHIGHLRVYTISDALNRFYQLKGYNVLHPMGWDAFGLPAENAAIERGVNPAVWTKQNIVKMKEQMNLMASNFNWEREVTTCDPDYYKFTQKLFLELFKNGYAYRKEAEINWDPIDQTVLANEQVDSEGKSWRSGALVEKRLLSQWFLGITKFAHELQHDLDNLDQWPEHVKRMQRNWIGESNGVEVVFNVSSGEEIKVFTTRAETLYSVQFVTLALDHPIVKDLKLADKDLQSFVNHAQKLPEGSKEGYMVPNLFCQHPLDTAKKIPVFVAPYVLGNYGHGAVMGCPAHDERDFDFWKQNCPEEPVIYTVTNPEETKMDYVQPFISKNGVMNENAKEFCGMSTYEARDAVADKLTNLGFGKSCVQFKLRDWLISRQRYWGAPIPIIHCESCGPVAVPDEDLPVKLPELNVLTKTGNPLVKSAEFVNVKCPSCGAPSKRETDTMDTFMDSSWYFFRFTDPQNKDLPFSYDKASKFMPIDLYIGGVEHAILHLLYSRFISKFTASIGMWDGEHSNGEPIKRLVTQGMVHGKTFVDSQTGRFLKPEEIDHSNSSTPKNASTGQPLIISHEKMSKSKHNGADPSACILKHGVDATRAHILFQAPVSDVLNWDESKIVGIERWLEKMLKYCSSLCSDKDIRLLSTTCFDMNQQEIKLHNGVQELLSSITMSLEQTLSLNTVISDYMKLSNLIEDSIKSPKIRKEFSLLNLQKLTTVLYPVVPCISEELASILKERGYDWDQYRWPLIENIQKSKLVKYQVIINGKKRLIYEEAEEFVQDTNKVIETLKSLPEAGKYLNDVEIKKIITKSNIISLVVA
ncbi:unnamed protein product [Kluyveromyces dobzhanskii CBS 2104]|uniref:leucine--tRNA ligase n=1 Tax=Kluyveromyces dobzhanskii CBS 2104 TaxID=1427455 RepID=A0A0A8L817_9SACH|nr:unnamed protein product [Kluyveromyces dobzhanskii CBS 2104]